MFYIIVENIIDIIVFVDLKMSGEKKLTAQYYQFIYKRQNTQPYFHILCNTCTHTYTHAREC